MFREIQVSFAQQNSSGRGSSQANAEDLADLFELELNKLKNQYETVQSAEQQERDEKVDEALERLKELAQRQQQLNQNNRLRAQQRGASSSSSGGGNQSQQQLMDQAEQLRRQLQRLSRERSSPELNEASNRIQRAIDEMKRSLNETQNSNAAETDAQGQRALQQLNEAIRDLAQGQQAGLREGLQRAVNESENLVKQQQKIQEELERLARQSPPPDTLEEAIERSENIVSRKETLAEQLNNLESRIRDLSRQARKTERSTSARIADAADTIQDRRLSDRIQDGNLLIQNGFYESQQMREDFIREGLEEVQQQLQSAESRMGESEEGTIEEAANRARQLAEGLESMRRRMTQSGQANSQGQRQEAQQGQGQSQAQQGQEGQPQGQQGQQGQAQGQRQAQQGQAQGEGQRQGQSGQQEASRQAGSRQQGQGNRGGTPQSGRNIQDPQPGFPDPNSDLREFTDNAMGPPVRNGEYRGERFRQWDRELEQRLTDAQDLRNLMNPYPTQAQTLEQVIDALMNSRANQDAGTQAQADYLKTAVELMRDVEFNLTRDLERMKQAEEYFITGDNNAPEDYRKLVEEYYKSIAEGK
ncbi:MAG: hypothetical protein P8Z37_04135 [Acidobacteriota bacterium]